MLRRLWATVDGIEAGLAETCSMKIRMVYVFGSVARGSRMPGDLDLILAYDEDDPDWRAWVVWKLIRFEDPDGPALRALRLGRSGYVDVVACSVRDLPRTLVDFETWPSPVLVWLDGERVGPLWTEIYGTSSPAIPFQEGYDRIARLLASRDARRHRF
jgi:hypothetical protein